jgi:hypothetical protein
MDETQTGGLDAWVMARVGNALDAGIDRVINRPQFVSDPSQAYGVDQNGNIYQLGKSNGQITASVQTNTAGGVAFNPMMMLLVIGVLYAVSAGK